MKESLEEMLHRQEVLFIRYATMHAMTDDMMEKLRDYMGHMFELHEKIRETYDNQQTDEAVKMEVKHTKNYH